MKFKKILVTGFDKSGLDENVWKRIEKSADKIVFKPESDVDCLFAKFNKIDKNFIDTLPNLKYIGLLATGYGTTDTEYAKQKGITVCNIPGYATEAVSEWVFALIIEHLRNLESARKVARKGDYSGDGFSSMEIKGKKFGVIGLGRIGARVVEIAQAFGAEIVYWSRNRKKGLEKKGIKYESIENVVSKSDFLSLHLNKNNETEGTINKKLVGLIKSGAIFINVSPMELIDFNALEKRLKKDDITFIFDHPDEMKPEDVKKLAKYDNCIVYPPIGFVTKEARAAKQEIFITNIEKYLENKTINRVN